MIKALIFDIGGVLSYDVWEHLLLDADNGIASLCNLDLDEVQRVGRELWDIFAHRTVNDKHDWKELERSYWNIFIDRFRLPMSPDQCIELTDKFIRPVEGMNQVLSNLQSREIKLAICSNNTEFWFERQMDKLGLYSFFDPDNIILSSRIGVSKSSPRSEMFHAVVNALRVDKDCCVLVDDREEIVQQAVEFGITGIIFPSQARHGARYLKALLEKMQVL